MNCPNGVGSGTIRVARSEFKYFVHAADVPAMTDWLSNYCIPDEFSRGGDWYSIRTLYLDTSDFRMYRDAAEGLPFRLKLRARTYGDATGDVKLEVKRRLRDLIVKTSATIRASDWNHVAPDGLSGLLALGKPSTLEFLQLAETFQAMPQVLVYYERKAFSSVVDDYVRVNFDRRMSCQPEHDWNLLGTPREWLSVDAPKTFGERESNYVLEIKFQDVPTAWLLDMTLRFNLERRGFSKYGRAVERGVLREEPAWDYCPFDGGWFAVEQRQSLWRGRGDAAASAGFAHVGCVKHLHQRHGRPSE